MSVPRLRLQDILEAIDNILEFTTDGHDTFLKEKRTQHAVIRNFEVMGEAAKRMPEPFRLAHPEIPWSLMARTRDKLIHDYPGIDPLVIWRAVIHDLPPLRARIEQLLGETSG